MPLQLTQLIRSVVDAAVSPLRSRLNAVVSRLVVDAINDAGGFQVLQVAVHADEVLPNVEHMQPGGLTHRPLAGAEGVLLCVAGYRDHPVAVAVANRERRPTGLQLGETGLYSATPGTAGLKVLLDQDGNIVLTPTATVTIAGSLLVTGEVTAMTAVPASAVGLSTHLHPSATGPTMPPTGGT